MATEKEVIQIEVDGGESVAKAKNSIAELKKELIAAKAAALNGDGAAAKRVAELTDKMEDLKDETNTLRGSGIEKLKNSFGLLTDGFKNFDGGKISTAFKGIGSAMKAIPLLLIVEGVRYLIENFDELSKGSGFLATILRAVGDAFEYVKNFITDLVGATDDSTRALEKQGEAIKESAEKAKEAIASQTAAFDRQIAVAKAAGKSTVELEKAKQQAIIDTNLAVARQIEAFVRAGGELDDEKKKLLSASLESIKNAKVQEYVIEQADNKQKTEAYKKSLEEKKKAKDELDAYNKKKAQDDLTAEQLQEQAARDLDRAARVEDEVLTQEQINAVKAAASAKAYEDELAESEKRKALKKKEIEEGLALTSQSLQASQALSDAFFALKIQGANGDAKKELELKKKQFQVNKAFAISNAIMSGIMGVQSQLQAGPIIGPILAGIVGVTAALNVAKIAAAKFDGGNIDTSGGSTSSATTLPSANTNLPTINPAQNNQNTTSFTGNQNNNFQQGPTKVFVTEVDVRKSKDRVDKLIEQSVY